ncbi:MAG: hypothetical protein OXT69_13050 [Candidatus Poribacteria bacterium]|nr:hypothetical protein [Candidatus Poribacteria bacterium]
MADKSKGFRGIFIACFLLALFSADSRDDPDRIQINNIGFAATYFNAANSDEPLS